VLEPNELEYTPDPPEKSEKKEKFEDDDGLCNKTGKNLRSALRYANTVSNAELFSKKLFIAFKPLPIELLDISTKGARFFTNRKLNLNTGFVLKVTFSDGKKFEVAGKIVRQDFKTENCYGFKFDVSQHGLGDYLFKTQTRPIVF
jgi:hypothetical protein